MKEQKNYAVSCQACSLNALCIPYSLTDDEIDIVDALIKRKKPIQRNKLVFESGDKFSSLYAVRAGAVKTYSVDQEGNESVIGFYLPGEMFGMDAIYSGKHLNTAIAVENTYVCEIPYNRLEELSGQIKNLQSHMFRALSGVISSDQQLQVLLGKKTAEERFANFLLNLSNRYQKRRLSPILFRLPLSRSDIANYLGIAPETVSRVVRRLQVSEILLLDGNDVHILDLHRLCQSAHGRNKNRDEQNNHKYPLLK